MPLPLIAGALALGARALPLLARFGKPVLSALRSTGRFLSGSPSRGGLIAMAAAPTVVTVAAGVAEHESGGALSEAAIDGTIAAIRAGLDSGVISPENVEAAIEATDYIRQISNVVDKAAQNQAVRLAMGNTDNPGDENIRNGKIAAITWQLSHIPSLAAKTLIRMGIADRLYDNKDDADRYIAEKFIDDIVEGAQVRALNGHPVSREDVRAALETAMKNDAGNTLIAGRLKHGLRLVWPDMFSADKPEVSTAASMSSVPSRTSKPDPVGLPLSAIDLDTVRGPQLSDLFERVTQDADKPNAGLGWQFNIMATIIKGLTGFLSALNVFGWADDIIDGMKRHVLEMAQDDVINQGENWFGASDARPHYQTVGIKPESPAP